MKTSKIFMIVALILVGIFAAQAGTTYVQIVDPINRIGKLGYSGTVTFTDTVVGAIYYTQAFYIGAVNYSDAMARFICSEVGTEDINVFIEYSVDGSAWVAGTTDSDLDAVGTTEVLDTIGIVQGVNELIYHTFFFMRYKFVAGVAVNDGLVLTWVTAFIKPAGLERVRVDLVKNI